MANRCLYFAFGSNLSLAQMRARCPSAQVEGTALIAGYRLAFVGKSRLWGGGAVATLLPDRRGTAVGMLYSLTPQDLQALDGYEGHPQHYRRRRMRVRDADGYERRAHVYFLDGTPGMPSPAYFWRIADAYLRLGFNPHDLEQALPPVEKYYG